jgi:hypothetical protein
VQRRVPLLLTSLAGLTTLLYYFIPHPVVSVPGHFLEESIIIVVAFAIVLGAANVLKVNGEVLVRRGKDWPYKALLLLSMFAMIGIGLADGPQRYLTPESRFTWMYDTFYASMQASMFALLAFFIASAAFRAFRIRNLDAALLAVAAVIVMLGRVPVGNLLSSWLPEPVQFPTVANWLMEVPQNAAKRGILIGAALGVMSTGLRIILGVEGSFVRGGERAG